ncbi:MAG: hypothetical protein NDI82_05690 [Anaeromyxobacteraceae bacterium]|nr:hypothetical protein [Anaeromyxobacteraceae bacterium]
MATTHAGSQAVPSGYYLNASRWAIEPVAEDGGRLPAGPGRWRRIPTAAALLATPLLGLAFLVFLPFIGFALTAQAALGPVGRFFQEAAVGLTAAMSPGHAVGAAHLTGLPGAAGAVEERGPPSRWLLLAAPFVGLAYVVFLPVVALVTVGAALLRRATGHVSDGASELAATVAPDVATGAAYLGGREGEGKPAAEATPELERLARELEEKRR